MKKLLGALATLAGFSIATAEVDLPNQIYDFAVKDIDGKEVKLQKFKGKVLLVVNVASKCGLTPQYEGLEKLYQKYQKKGLVILGFPANDFLWQEPGTDVEIKEFCSAKYGVTFPMFSKIHVKGKDIAPLYQWLLAKAPSHDEIEWNFAKFLLSRDGQVIGRFTPKTKPEDPDLVKSIEAALKPVKAKPSETVGH